MGALLGFAVVRPWGSWAEPQNNPTPASGGTQVAGPVIKVQAPSVVVDVIVTDKKGRPVPDLSAADFAVFENNNLQKIVTFVPPLAAAGQPPAVKAKSESAPSSAPPAPSAPPAMAPPSKPEEREARDLASVHFITLVLDLGDLQPAHIKHACDAASKYLQKDVAADDFVAIYWVDQSLHLALAFTKDRPQALAALSRLSGHTSGGRYTTQERLETEQEIENLTQEIYGAEASSGLGAGPTSAAPGVGSAGVGRGAASARGGGAASGPQPIRNQMEKLELATLMKFLWSLNALQARAVLVALRAIAQAYQSLPGRKNVVVFSEGFLHAPEVQPQIQAVVDSANRANVAFYIIDAGGLTAEAYDASDDGPPDPQGTREAYRIAGWGQDDQLSTDLSKFDWSEHIRGVDSKHEDLGQVAAATGGLMMKNQNDLLAGLESVDRDLREFYTLVYQPTDTNYDGSFRRIKVEMLQSGLHVRYRPGYWAIPAGEEMIMTPAAAQLLAAIENGSLRPSFAPAINAALLFAPDGRLVAPVRVSLPAKQIALERDGDRYKGGATLLVVARDLNGRPVSVHQRFLSFDFSKIQWEEFRKTNLDISARLSLFELKPLTVEAILQLPSGSVAQGHCQVLPSIRSPDSNSSPVLALTSLLLSNSIVPPQGATDPADPLRGQDFQIRLPPTPRFAPNGKLTLYYGILLSGVAEQSRNLHAVYTMKSSAGAVVMSNAEDLAIRPSQNRLLVLKQFDLSRVLAGKYTMEVAATETVGTGAASTSVTFTVE